MPSAHPGLNPEERKRRSPPPQHPHLHVPAFTCPRNELCPHYPLPAAIRRGALPVPVPPGCGARGTLVRLILKPKTAPSFPPQNPRKEALGVGAQEMIPAPGVASGPRISLGGLGCCCCCCSVFASCFLPTSTPLHPGEAFLSPSDLSVPRPSIPLAQQPCPPQHPSWARESRLCQRGLGPARLPTSGMGTSCLSRHLLCQCCPTPHLGVGCSFHSLVRRDHCPTFPPPVWYHVPPSVRGFVFTPLGVFCHI